MSAMKPTQSLRFGKKKCYQIQNKSTTGNRASFDRKLLLSIYSLRGPEACFSLLAFVQPLMCIISNVMLLYTEDL